MTIIHRLSKLRKLKHLALMLCQPSIQFLTIHISLVNQKTVNFDIGTLALAFCYFERLVLYGVFNNVLSIRNSMSIKRIGKL